MGDLDDVKENCDDWQRLHLSWWCCWLHGQLILATPQSTSTPHSQLEHQEVSECDPQVSAKLLCAFLPSLIPHNFDWFFTLYESSPAFHLWYTREMKWPPQKITLAFHKVSLKGRKHLHVAHPRGKSSTISHQISHLDHPSGAGNWTENSSTLTQLTKGAHKKRLPGRGLFRDWFVSMREDPKKD